MFTRIARYSALLLITAVVIWALVLGWWQSNDHTPSPGESLLYLLALPIALFGGFIFLNSFLQSMRSVPVVAEQAARDDTSKADEAALARQAEVRRRQLAILASAVCVPGAADLAGFISLVREGKTPQPDKQLRDEDGFPAFIARNDALDEASVAEHLSSFGDSTTWPHGFARNMALLDEVLTGMLPDVQGLLDSDGHQERYLRLHWLTDTSLGKAQMDTVRDWLSRTHLSAFNDRRTEITIEHTDDTIAAASTIEHLCELAGGTTDPALTLLVATASKVSESVLRHWQASGRLFLPDHQQGQIPGEVGAAVLLGAPAVATELSLDSPVFVSRPNAHARDKSADAAGKISARLCARLCQELLTLFSVPPARLKGLVTDSDHRASRQAEALGIIDETYENLEPAQDFLPLGTASGSAPPASALLMLASAAHLANETQAPVLALSVQHPTRRAALLLLPRPDTASSNSSE